MTLLPELLLGLGLGVLIGVGLSSIWYLKKLNVSALKNAELNAKLISEEQRIKDIDQQLSSVRHELSASFAELADNSLKHNTDHFLTLAREHLTQHQVKAEHDLSDRQKSIETLVSPLREHLEKARKEMNTMEEKRAGAFGDIERYLKTVSQTQQALHDQTHKLVGALQSNQVRGRWGEISLRRIVELAGLIEHCDFEEQASIGNKDKMLRPDLIVRLPEQRAIVIDAKVPLSAYLDALEAGTEAEQKNLLKQHATQVRNQVKHLSTKKYWQALNDAPPFVVLYLPGDAFLTAALMADNTLLEDAFDHNVVLATPSSLLALLKAIALGWQQHAMSENTVKILQVADALQEKLSRFTEHFARTGTRLEKSVDAYNSALYQLESGVLKQSQQLKDLGATPIGNREQPKPIDTDVKPIKSLKRPMDAAAND